MRSINLSELRTLAQQACGQISTIYLHWTAGHHCQAFNDYHINVLGDGTVVVSCDDLTEIKSHTWHRNSGAIGIALSCCYQATSNDLGPEPPTDAQIEAVAQVVAVLAQELGLDITRDNVMTHAEAADLDGYGPSSTCDRWDLAILHNGDMWMSGGAILRGKAEFYRQTMQQ